VLAVHDALSERGPDDNFDVSRPSVEQRRR